jgi:hypothetical protein
VAGLLRAESTFRRVKGHRAMPALLKALEALVRGDRLESGVALRENAGETAPSHCARRRHHENPDDVNDLTEWCINQWPIHPGARNNTQAKLILSLLARRVDPDTIEEIGAKWFAHFQPSPDCEDHDQTSLSEAIRLFNDCVDTPPRVTLWVNSNSPRRTRRTTWTRPAPCSLRQHRSGS